MLLSLLVVCLTSFLYAPDREVRSAERPFIDIYQVPDEAIEEGRIWIQFREEMSGYLDNLEIRIDSEGVIILGISGIDDLNRTYAVYEVTRLFDSPSLKNEYEWRHRRWGLHLWYEFRFADKGDIRDIVMAYRDLKDILDWAEPEYKKRLISSPVQNFADYRDFSRWTPNDPQLGNQWHYNNTGQQNGAPGADISMFSAWEIEKGHSDVVVAVIDDGIQFNHPDLAGNMWAGIGFNFVDNTSTINPGDHGTHVAGTVAAVNNNSVGVAGVAGGSGLDDGVRLMSCQVFRGNSQDGFHVAPVYAADNGAAISQNSWGYGSPRVYNQPVLDAIDYFNLNGGGTVLNGGLTVFAAGNDNTNGQFYPACYPGAFSVAATNNQDQRSWYSTYDTWVDISAPGGETNSVTARGVLSTITSSSYQYYQGTSMACPHASGVAALITSLAHRNGEMLDNLDIADILRNTTDYHYDANPGFIGQLGTGRLNANAALLEVQDMLTGVMNPRNFTAVAVGTSQIDLSWLMNNDNNDVMLVWTPDGVFGIPENGVVYLAGQEIPGGGNVLYRGSETNFSHSDLEETTTYYYKAFSYDLTNHYSSGRATTATTDYEPFILPFTEDFNVSAAIPALWQVSEYQGSGLLWQVGTLSGGLSGTTGDYAYISGALLANTDTDLITPTINMSAYSDIAVSFSHYASASWLGSFTAAFSYSLDNGLNWTEIASWSASTANPAIFNQTIPALSGEPLVKFKWNFTSTWASHFWCFDDLTISGEFAGLPVPQDLTAEAGNEEVNLSWSAPGSATPQGYNVYRDDLLLNSDPVLQTEFADPDVQNFVTYNYFVTALYQEGESAPSNNAEATPYWLQPPGSLTATPFHNQVILEWEESFTDDLEVLGYNVYRDDQQINPELLIETGYEDSSVENDVEYQYYVTAICDFGESGASNVVEATPYSLNPPQNLTAAPLNGSIELSWEEPEPQGLVILGYNIYRDQELLNTEAVTANEFADSEVINDEIYHYHVTALYDEGESEPSNEVEIEAFVNAEDHLNLPLSTRLHANYPNPFNPETTINFDLKQAGFVSIEVFNIKGQKVTTLIDDYREAGSYRLVWNGKNDSKREINSGIFFYRMKSGEYTATRKMILLK
jgi:subtilisin family serine protease/fibronectin type 3 domain-containing protein